MTSARSVRTWLAPVLGAALVIAACGGSDDDSAGGGSTEAWCSFAVEAERVDVIFDTLGDDPTVVESNLNEVKTIAQRLPGIAPDEVKNAAKTLSDNALLYVKVFEDADFNILDVNLALLTDPTFQSSTDAANATVDAFTLGECGRPFGLEDDNATPPDDPTGDPTGDQVGDDDDDDAFDPAQGTLREQLVSQLESIGLSNSEAACIADNLDFSDPAVQSGDIASMLQFFAQCDIALDRLGELGQG